MEYYYYPDLSDTDFIRLINKLPGPITLEGLNLSPTHAENTLNYSEIIFGSS